MNGYEYTMNDGERGNNETIGGKLVTVSPHICHKHYMNRSAIEPGSIAVIKGRLSEPRHRSFAGRWR
jgi:hypothetical protein